MDIDAARGEGSNEALIAELCTRAKVRVGGGIRDPRHRPPLARPRRRTGDNRDRGNAAAARRPPPPPRGRGARRPGRHGLSHGWRRSTGRDLIDRIGELRPLCGGLLVTFVEREGHLAGTDLARAEAVVAAAGDTRVTIAGGITTAEEIAALDRIGADAQVGMALYTGRIGLAEAVAAVLVSDRIDGLWPTVVTDEGGFALGLAWSDAGSLAAAIETRAGCTTADPGAGGSRARRGGGPGAAGGRRRLRPGHAPLHRPRARRLLPHRRAHLLGAPIGGWVGSSAGWRPSSAGTDPASNTGALLERPTLLLAAKLVEEATELAGVDGPRGGGSRSSRPPLLPDGQGRRLRGPAATHHGRARPSGSGG